MNMSNGTESTDHALGWKPLQTKRKKNKAKFMYKLLNKMGPKSLTNLFTYKGEMTNYKLRNISSSLCLPQPRSNNMKKVLCMTEPTFEILLPNSWPNLCMQSLK